ncbi:glycosyltransferase family 4 protein [Mucilaginibacter glaciei]|uniref:Glycosyltransferase family 4 protein n=1 Tax=Mucilaginibacter glaciei TaxID=2772109 RepID=A0A926NHS4_9SPHI|nr:glycosyltransferase family 4 protein [Mucilaginibacter glaciei]MBD1392309.1 glycosyltransferase family 4 protein [Mucilaginibacter glaciei]
MKVAFIVRPNLYTIAGGDTVQIDQTARQLRNLDVEVDIFLSNKPIPYKKYDLLNFFHITRPAAILYHSDLAKMPFVISTIHCPYGDYDKYHPSVANTLFSWLSEDAKDYLRIVSRWLRFKETIPLRYLWNGQHKSVVEVLNKAAAILPNSQSEMNRVVNSYTNVKGVVITNGINPDKFLYDPQIVKDKRLIICVGRIEKRKNQLNLIKALNGTDYKLVLIGAPSPTQLPYFNKCKAVAGPNVKFLNRIPHDEMVNYYQMAKVHVLASWFETTGLSTLEAALMHCNIVITDKGDTKDYFGDYAFYCTPESPESIRAAVEKAAKANFDDSLAQKIKTWHTWLKAAEQTFDAYKAAVNK